MANERAVDAFLLEHIDSVPHLEALLLLWNSRPRSWSVDEVARSLFLTTDATRVILGDLVRKDFISCAAADCECCHYASRQDHDETVAAVDMAYRKELIRVTRLIHSKPSAAVRAFAQAFRLKKDPE
jgi:hypothetical protein